MLVATGKYIGINQRVPFKVLDQGLLHLLQKGEVNREELKQDLREFTKGENRVSKAAGYAYQILTRPQKLLKIIQQHFSAESYARLPTEERKVLILSLFAATYPIVYDLLIALATLFKVQPQVSKSYIRQRMSITYGSNRTLDIALDALMPMLIELGLLTRAKVSIYEVAPTAAIITPIVAECYVYTDIKLSGSKSILFDDLESRPWYFYKSVGFKKDTRTKVLKHAESRIGGGYLTVGA